MKPVTMTALAGTSALTIALLAAAPFGSPALGASAGLALAGAGMVACGMALRRQRHEAEAAAHPVPVIAPAAMAPTAQFFPLGGVNGQVVPFGRKTGVASESRLSRDLVRRAERVCSKSRARIIDDGR